MGLNDSPKASEVVNLGQTTGSTSTYHAICLIASNFEAKVEIGLLKKPKQDLDLHQITIFQVSRFSQKPHSSHVPF